MKGVVFTEFLEMVEDTFSPDVVDEMIMSSELESNGFYTSVGTYDHKEMVEMVTQLSEMTEVPIGDLLEKYGAYLFAKLIEGYPGFLEGIDSSFDFLKTIDNHIHVEVRKLYPDAELPKFDFEQPADNTLVLKYASPRGFGAFAYGMMTGCIAYFEEDIDVVQKDLSDGAGKVVEFTLTRKG
ncbi:MAG: heme NO-binding domain-containing protein [Rhodothermales bacterium]